MTDKELKKLFLKILHGGGLDRHSSQIPLLIEFEAAVKHIIEMLSGHPTYNAMFEAIEADPKKSNVSGSFISHVWQKAENEVIVCLKEFLEEDGYRIGCLAFDGLLVELGGDDIDADLLAAAEDHIESETGYRVTLVVKPSTPTASDWEKFLGPKALQKILSNAARCTYLIEYAGQLQCLKRMDGRVFRPHKTIPGVYCQGEEDFEFVNSALRGAHGVISSKVLLEWFAGTDSVRFPLLTRAKMANEKISFQNAVFDIDTLSITSWDELKGEPPFTEHFFDSKINDQTHLQPTPLWCRILNHQMDLECKDLAEVLIGRLFYPVGKYDNWQVCPFYLGDACTGKSTILDLIQGMFPRGSVGCLTANKEAIFGLESLISKRLVQAPDVPLKMKPILDQTIFQSMVSGEAVSVARKNLKALADRAWTVPLIFAGNAFPEDYNDASGSISRRFVVFKFLNLVTDRDAHLKRKILETELVTILLRCIRAYRAKVVEIGSREFWDCVPRTLLKEREAVKKESNYLQRFLADGSSSWQVIHQPGAMTTLQELGKVFSEFMEVDIHRPGCIGSDYFPIKDAGFIMKSVQMCKYISPEGVPCGKKATVANCGEHFNKQNRSQLVCILDMALVRANPLQAL